VLAHEITHILQGISRHSASGVMKARWTINDFAGMSIHPLRFEEEDVDLIYEGLARRARLAQRLRELSKNDERSLAAAAQNW
jgi:hypothetical protein